MASSQSDVFLIASSQREANSSLSDCGSFTDGVADKELPRNALFVFAALPFARELSVDEIALGSNLDDTAVPDGSPAFVEAVNQVLEATEQPKRLIGPLDSTSNVENGSFCWLFGNTISRGLFVQLPTSFSEVVDVRFRGPCGRGPLGRAYCLRRE
jgi:Queuosine biosynthesis protein QueC